MALWTRLASLILLYFLENERTKFGQNNLEFYFQKSITQCSCYFRLKYSDLLSISFQIIFKDYFPPLLLLRMILLKVFSRTIRWRVSVKSGLCICYNSVLSCYKMFSQFPRVTCIMTKTNTQKSQSKHSYLGFIQSLWKFIYLFFT